MINLASYTKNVWLTLAEGGKYFALLVFSILAIRLWRRWARIPAARNTGGLVAAGVTTALAVAIGYVAMRQSLSSVDSYYGMQAFQEGRLPQALELFELAEQNWRNADTVSQHGVCLLMLGNADQGLALISKAQTMRRGYCTFFEVFYEGLYRFSIGDATAAMPLLQAATNDPNHSWTAIKLIAVLDLDENRVAAAAELMKPFAQTEVAQFDQAYVMARLKLADGKKAEALALLDKFPAANLTPMWQSRFEKLRAQLRD